MFHSSLSKQPKEETETQTEEAEPTEYYMVVGVDQIEESLLLYRYENGMEYRYYYGSGTRFHDKYGNRATIVEFTEGAIVTIGAVDSEGYLSEVNKNDKVWEYEDVTRFSIDGERNIFEIAGTRYQYDKNHLYVFSNMEKVGIEAISQGDTLSVVGMDKQILSIRVTTGQGVLQLKNTALFEGSFLQLGSRIFAEITPDMQLPVEEGTYELRVANKGWGGSREVTIRRGETTLVDLDELKGEGPKLGYVKFLVDVEDAVMIIDGNTIDYSKPVGLTYGVHNIGVYVSGFDAWERRLHVNSKEATIVIQLKEEETETDDSEVETKEDETSSEKDRVEQELELIKDLITSMGT